MISRQNGSGKKWLAVTSVHASYKNFSKIRQKAEISLKAVGCPLCSFYFVLHLLVSDFLSEGINTSMAPRGNRRDEMQWPASYQYTSANNIATVRVTEGGAGEELLGFGV